MRLDQKLVEEGFFDSREKAKRSIMAGEVLVDNTPITKAGTAIKEGVEIRLRGKQIPYVSRGGLKLEGAILKFGLDFNETTVLDVGASTGGFTDCALQHGANFVYAVDVGHNQISWKMKTHALVKSIEGMHIKNLTLQDIDEKQVDFIVMDVSFISLTHVLEYLPQFLLDTGKIIALIKPQFEVGKENVENKGIIKNPKLHEMAIRNVVEHAKSLDLFLQGLSVSPILGGKGNKEFLAVFSRQLQCDQDDLLIEAVLKDNGVQTI